MSFLDRFKPQPRWKHADPLVRLGAVESLAENNGHRQVLVDLASADEDVRVRRAASLRLRSAAELVSLVRSEPDAELRRELAERLVAIANAPAESDAEGALALTGLEDQRHLAAVARSSPHDTVRSAALSRVHDTKALGSIARNAVSATTALEAASRITDSTELVTVAIKTDHKDAGIAALERAAEASDAGAAKDLLDAVASRAKNKSVAKRARAMMQAIEEAEAARRSALEAWQQKVAALVARVEALGAAPGTPGAAEELAQAQADWAGLGLDGSFELDADTSARFAAAVERAHAAIEEHERAEAERRAAEERRSQARAARLALIERAAAAQSEDLPAEIAAIRAEWDALEAVEGVDLEELGARFDAACAEAEQRHRNRLEMQQIHARLAELAADAERLASEDPLPREAWDALIAEWEPLHARSEGLDESIAERYRQAVARVREREEQRRAAAERALHQQVQRVEQLIDRAHKRSQAEDLTLREAERLVRDLRAATEAPPALGGSEQAALVERLKAATAAILPKLHELREMDEWKRFANAAVQEELIARTEAIRVKYGFDAPEGPKTEDLEKAARELHEIQEQWKTVAEAPRAQAQALWHRYRQAADPIQARLREFFASRNEERKANLEKKLALIARAEELADSTDWIRTADELKKLQAEWQQIGPTPRQDTKATWKRFRDACDKFFTRRNADLAQRKEIWAANLAKKEALCQRAEELAASREWDKAAAEIRRLQAEWKTIGPVRRNKSEAVWQRFRSACDTFFERYKRRDEIDLESKQADREQLVAELEALVPAGPETNGTDPARLLEQVRSLRSRWNQTTPVVRHGSDPLSARFMAALERTLAAYPEAFRGTELDVEPNRQKMEKLIARVEGFLAEAAPPPVNSSQALANMLREALAANTIGGRSGEESKWRAMAEDVRQAQASWSRLGPVPGETGRQLSERFHRATSRFFEIYRRKVPPQQSAHRGARAVETR